ncbi:hypothetical protein [Paenibacillus typhae]|uniref:hypothetical protein n=1 Tax=Paenibacillus typhae TaxID=1174501 RepID=UPI0039F14D0E
MTKKGTPEGLAPVFLLKISESKNLQIYTGLIFPAETVAAFLRTAKPFLLAYLSETGLSGTTVETADLNKTFCLPSPCPVRVIV